MTDRIFRKDQNVVTAVEAIGSTNADFYSEHLLRVYSWDTISPANQALITATLSGFNYTFAFDI